MSDDHNRAAEVTGGDTGEPSGTPRERGPGRPLRVALVTAAVALLLVVALDVVTESPALCASCHEMSARTASWRRSAHGEVGCVACHQAPRPWYDLPRRLAGRAGLLARDVAAHLRGGYPDPVDATVRGGATVTDDVCLQCHDPERKATSGFRIRIDHAAHAKRNGSCISCHVRTAHPIATRSTALSLMSQCFTCHGTGRNAKAPGDCELCHPAGYALRPASHRQASWKTGHGRAAGADLRQCEMCHAPSSCDGCHGLAMPHPMGWVGGASGHSGVAQRDRALCSKCHGGQPDMCVRCHHPAYDPSKGTWEKEHATEVEKRGTYACFRCHSPQDCVRCHESR